MIQLSVKTAHSFESYWDFAPDFKPPNNHLFASNLPDSGRDSSPERQEHRLVNN